MSEHKKPAKAATVTAAELASWDLSAIARFVNRDWRRVWSGAVPYVDAMLSLRTLDDVYGLDDARGIVLRFLVNAQQYRGANARLVKAELNARLKPSRKATAAG